MIQTVEGDPIITAGLPIAVGTDGIMSAFSKVYKDEDLAIQTQFHIAESYFELFKSHLKLEHEEDAQADLATFIMLKVAGAYFFEAIMALLVAAGIFNTIFVSVMERLREFGVLLAIGFSPRRLFGLVMFESFWLGVVGLVFAALLSAWPYYFLATTGIDISDMIGDGNAEVAGVAIAPTIKAGIYPESFVYIILAALVATLLSGLYPAWKAGRIAPVESIKLV